MHTQRRNMGENSKLVAYTQNDIASVMKVINEISKRKDTMYFYNFAKSYGTKKICGILNSRGVDAYGISVDANFDVVDKISKNIFNKISKENYINSLLYTPYYYSKYVLNPQNNSMQEQKIWIAYNVLVNNKNVNIKQKYTIKSMKNLVESGDAVLLGVKEKLLTGDSYFFEGLTQVDKDFVATAENAFVQKSIFPSVKFANNDAVLNNLASFEKKYPLLTDEMNKVNKKIAQKVLQYEIENQQIVLSSALEKGQQQFQNLVLEYQTKASKIQNLINLNQRLLSALGTSPRSKDYEFEKEL